MLYFHYQPSKEEDPIQGIVKEEEDGTFLLLDRLQPSDRNGNAYEVRESIVVRLPRSKTLPPSLRSAAPIERTPPTSPRSAASPQVPNAPRLSVGLAVGLGVNVLALLAGAYLLQFAVPSGELHAVQTASTSAVHPQTPSEADLEQAFRAGRWQQVLQWSEALPDDRALRQRVAPLIEQARSRLDAEAYEWLQVAFDRARAKDFQGALQALDRVPAESSLYERVAPKLAEYRQKRDVRANWLLQRAFDRAQVRDFAAALAYLERIPPGTSAYQKVAPKLAQYRQQQNLRANWLLQQAFDRAVDRRFSEALSYLKRIPIGTEAYAIAQAKILEYRQR